MSDLLGLSLPAGLTARGATMGDVPAAVAVTQAAERHDGLGSLTVHDDIAGDWARPSMDVAADVILVEEHGRVVAYAEQFRGRAFAHVHPDAHGRGIGSAIAEWSERHARNAGLEHVGQTIPASARRGRSLLEGRGYSPRWEAWILKMPLAGELSDPVLPSGVVVRGLCRPDDDRGLYDVVEEAFATWPDRDPSMDFEDWRTSLLDRATDLDLVLVAEEDRQVVGAALCIPEGDEGWVDQLAVRPDRWGRGIGGALLRAAFRRFAERGLTVAALSTDSRTGALGLYEHVGMTVTESFTRYSLRLR